MNNKQKAVVVRVEEDERMEMEVSGDVEETVDVLRTCLDIIDQKTSEAAMWKRRHQSLRLYSAITTVMCAFLLWRFILSCL